MSREQPGEDDGAMGTEVKPVGDENVETEVEFRPPHGTNRMSEERPIIMGVVGAETYKQDSGQTNRFRFLGGAKLKRPEFELPNPQTPGTCRTPPGTGETVGKSQEPTGSPLKCRPQRIQGR